MPHPFDLSPREKLELIQRLDCFHPWSSLDEERECRRCGAIFTGTQIEIEGGSPGFGLLRLHCPTESCCAVPIEWMLLEEKASAK